MSTISTNKNKQNLNNLNNNQNKEYHIVTICDCNKDDATNVCLKCNKFICESCKKRDPHIIHQNEVLKLSKFKDYIKNLIDKTNSKLDDSIISDETFIYMQNFMFNFQHDIEQINKSYNYLKSIIEEIKDIQIDYLIKLQNKMEYNEKYKDINEKVTNLVEEFNVYSNELHNNSNSNINSNSNTNNTNFNNCDNLISIKKSVQFESETIINKYKYLCSLFGLYLNTTNSIENVNKTLINGIKEKFLFSQNNFSLQMLTNKIAKISKSEFNKKNKFFTDQVVMRIKDSSTLLYCKLKKNCESIKTHKIIDNDNFKHNFQLNDEIEINVDNKLFIVTGKKYNLFYCYDFVKSEIFQLDDLKTGHFYGGVFYTPATNSIYSIGGINTKKCEYYRNDDLIFPTDIKEKDLRAINTNNSINQQNNNIHQWEYAPELNVYRQEFAGIISNQFIYIFFGFNNLTNINNNTVERLNIIKNDKWEIIAYSNPGHLILGLSSHGILSKSETEILILGGYDGKSYKDAIITYNFSDEYVFTDAV